MPISKFKETEAFQQMLKDYQLNLSDFTCLGCKYKETCGYAFDPYNTNGDCLANK